MPFDSAMEVATMRLVKYVIQETKISWLLSCYLFSATTIALSLKIKQALKVV